VTTTDGVNGTPPEVGGGRLFSRRIWSAHLLQGRPRRRLHWLLGGRPSDRSTWQLSALLCELERLLVTWRRDRRELRRRLIDSEIDGRPVGAIMSSEKNCCHLIHTSAWGVKTCMHVQAVYMSCTMLIGCRFYLARGQALGRHLRLTSRCSSPARQWVAEKWFPAGLPVVTGRRAASLSSRTDSSWSPTQLQFTDERFIRPTDEQTTADNTSCRGFSCSKPRRSGLTVNSSFSSQ